MGRAVSWGWAFLGTALLGLASCAGSSPPSTGATVPTAILGEPYAVPAVITKAYLQRVLNAMEVVNARAASLIIAHKALVPEAVAALGTIDTPPELQIQKTGWQQDLRGGLANALPNPGTVHDKVTAILATTPSCVFLSAIRDFSQVDRRPPTYTSYFALSQRPGDSTSGLNPTPWVISFLGGTASGAPPPDQCP